MLEETFKNIIVGDIKIQCGDLNAKAVKHNTYCQNIMGQHRHGTMNETREVFADFCLN